MKKYKAIIYDIDGTLLDTLKMNMYPLMKIIKEETGEDWTFEQVLKFASYPGMKVMEELGVKDQEKTYARWVQYVNDYEDGATLFEGFEEVLETFKNKKIKQAIVSSKLREQYEKEVIPALMKKFEYKSVMQVPRLDKIVINIGLGDTKENPKSLENAMNDLTQITGQRPMITKAKKSIAAFKLREGANVGCKVTLRKDKMYDFANKLFNVALPRVRDFRGVSANSFDGRGNYSMGLKEQLVFPEIEYDKIDKLRGMDIIFVTTAETDEEAKELLKLLGMPFKA